MKKITTFGFLILVGLSFYCHSSKMGIKQSGLVRYFYLGKLEVFEDKSQKNINVFDTTFITYFNESKVLTKPIITTDFKAIQKGDSIILSDSGQPDYNTYHYALIKQGDPIALHYTTYDKTNSAKLDADSLWKKQVAIIPNIIDNKTDSLVRVKQNRNERTEYYLTPRKPDNSYPDSIILNYDARLNDVPLSLSPKLDQLHKKKLFRVQMIYNSYFDSNRKKVMPPRVFLFEVNRMGEEKDRFVKKLLGIG